MEITIDKQKIEVEKGKTVLEAAEENGIAIPTLCHSPFLEDVGACRMCLIEDLADGKLKTSCTTEVKDGMEVLTKSKRVEDSRRTILDLLISDHPLDCMTCEADGSCTLQDLAYQYGIERSSYGTKSEPRFKVERDNEFIELDPDKCILCGKCIRVDQDIQCSDAIDFVERGFQTKVGAASDEGLGGEDSTCVFCGQCVELCPTGALSYIPSQKKGREYNFEKTVTTCPYCGVGCQLELKTKDRKVIEVGSVYREGTPNPYGEACVKGRFGYDFINHPDRLKKPLIKRNGKFEEAEWEEALSLVAEKLTEIKDEYGGRALAGLSSAKCTNEENYLMQKFMRAVIGTNSVDHCARLCHASTVAGLVKAFGSGAMTNSISEIEGSDLIFVIGSNPTENHPVIGSKMKKAHKNRTKLIVADPRQIELSGLAEVAVQQQPGTDVALLNGLMHVIIEEGLADQEFIAERTENYEYLASVVEDYTPEKVAEITGVEAAKIKKAARLFAEADKAAIYFAMGITQHRTGTDNVLSVANLALLTGNVGRESTGVNPLRGQNNVQGACDLGALSNVYPGYQSVEDPEIKEKFARAWETEELSAEVGLTVVEIFKQAGEDIRGLYIIGENPVISDPDQRHIEEALDSLDFLVVEDIFLTETAQFADVVLPAACFAEKEGSFTNTERRIQKVNKAIGPPGEARADWKIISEISTRMGYQMNYDSPADIMAEIAEVTPIYGGIYADRLGDQGLQWPCKDREDPGTKFLHQGEFARGKGKFHPVTYIPPAEEVDDEYDYIMMTGRMLYHFHTGTMTRNSEPIDKHEPDAYLEINKKDAKKLRIKEGDRVRVTSRRGEVETNVRIGDRVQPGQIFMPFHYAESPANRLTNPVLDKDAKIPELKVTAVKIEKV
ncbi:NAD-dependent formate dehydrogenase catalytic subunit [Halanaerobium saccharolyticum]|uniref:NAD-dependent formate dehydrogenase catalytic subunit n=1 Tax=Halanaerobium saccharolyticum TaxID=43595 RepID=A0A2T5RKP6_9FIRM|nr:NAD-dependent formate dehydrogenase catalytic subunit [Halanaerobium saccharolyticum]TDP98254.1 NAD-dependent formate dehydrogenase catalytic subunit [Halanaerobium saccharolyticum]